MNVVRKMETYTIEDIYALPEGERAELIDGKIYYMAAPSRTHQSLLLSLSRQMDYYKKLLKYCTAGVRVYWVVDPDKDIVTVYDFEADTMTEYSFGEDVPVGIYEGFSIRAQ